MPVLGICRGMQLTNVAFGGTLIPDIEEAGYAEHRSSVPGAICTHGIVVTPGSSLAELGGADGVNSSHHQAVLQPGAGLKVIARSPDGIIEAMEPDEPSPFLLLVQWHPERMEDRSSPLAGGVLRMFLHAVQSSPYSLTTTK